MEQNAPNSLFDLQVDYDSGNFLKEASKWTKFISIVAFICLGLLLLALLFGGSAMMMSMSTVMPGLAALGGLLMIPILIGVAITVFLVIQLYLFATLTRRGIEQQDQFSFNRGLKALRNYFVVYGVLSILSLIGSFFSLMFTF